MLAYFTALIVITMLFVPAELRTALQVVVAAIATDLIGRFGIEATRQGTLILLPGITLAVDWACTAITILELYVALILAYRSGWAVKAVGISVGVAVILVANQLRIVATALAAEYWPSVLYVAHDYLFQVSMVVVAVALWAWWLGLVNRREGRDG